AALSAAWAPGPLTPADEESDHGANAPPGSPNSVRAGTQRQAERPSPRARRSYGRATIWRIAWSALRLRRERNDHRWRGDIGPWSSRRARPSRLSADAAFRGGLDGGLPARHDQASSRSRGVRPVSPPACPGGSRTTSPDGGAESRARRCAALHGHGDGGPPNGGDLSALRDR